MDFSCSRKAGCLKKFCAFCCTYKRDLLKNNNFEKTIEIFPRVITCQKLERCGTYQQELTVRNTGTLTRRVKFFTEPNSDTAFKIIGNTELTSGATVSVDIYVEPTKKKSINRNRFFYVFAEHPDIVWEIPILVICEPPVVYVPELICLHKVPANTTSNYQFVIYNPLDNDISFSICTNYENITISHQTNAVLAKNYCKILISGKVPKEIMTTSLVVTLNNGKCYRICVHMEPSEQVIHLSTSVLTFEDTFMGLKIQKNIHICNKSIENASFRWTCSETKEDVTTEDKGDEELIISQFLRIRNKRGCIPPMNSALSIITFTPPYDFDYNEEEEPPFKINIAVYLFCPILGTQSYRLQINANILGPAIEINPRDIDIGNVYMGQMQCLKIDAANRGPISGKLRFKEHTDENEIRCSFSPLPIDLKPNTSKSFQLKFFRHDIGRFLTRITFKIKSGNSLPILLRGTSLAAKVKIWPELFEFGYLPICIPQKRFALVTNPLPVPIVVEPMVVDDGDDDPMILCVDYSKLPLNARPATYYNLKYGKSMYAMKLEDELKPLYSDFGLDETVVKASNSQLSWMFQDKVLDDIPVMAKELLQNVKTLHPQNQIEPGMKIIDAALDCILDRSDYFEDLKYKQNYLHMDWEALPTDAREVGIEAERFYLKPNESKSFPVVLIPNSSGPTTQTIEFKACPLGVELSELNSGIRSKYMINTLRLQYQCIIPTLKCNDYVKFSNLYVDKEEHFYMKFKNIDVVPGFVYFKVIPKTATGEMKVVKSQQKFFIAPNTEVDVSCSVVFRKVGIVSLRGLFHLIGKLIGQPFSLKAQVLPPEIQITPEKVSNKQYVLETTRTRVFIENICPTVAKFSLSLKNEKYQSLEPLGGRLAPNQKILISIFSRYFDPGVYKNVIYVNLVHAEKLSIPVTIVVEGTPLYFEPNIKLGLDCGNIFKTKGSKDTLVNITNFGEKSYRLLFVKQKPKKQLLVPTPVFDIEPVGITLSAKGEETVKITLNTSKEITAEEDFSVDGMGEDNCRFKFFSFTAKGNVIKSKVVWSKNQICLEMGNNNDWMSDIVSLINTTPLAVDVSLNVLGYYIIRDNATGTMGKGVSLRLEGKAAKQFTISLNENEVDAHDICQCFKGSIKCKVNNKSQKPLLLHAKIVNPGLKISTPQVTFFSQNTESYAHIYVHNCSVLEAQFTWKQTAFRLIKTESPKDLLSSVTISEMILNLPEEVVLQIPDFIKTQPLQVCPSNETISDEEISEESKSSVSQNQSSEEKSSSGNNVSVSKKASSSLKSSGTKESSESVVIKPKPCKPLPIKAEIQQIDINRVLHYLGLTQPLYLEPTNTTNTHRELDIGDRNYEAKDIEFYKFKQNKPIIFQENRGCVSPKTMFKAYMFLPPVPEGDTLVWKFDLDVLGGRTETLDVTVTSLKGRVEISKTVIDLGAVLWHKIISDKIQLINHCPYAVKITLIEDAETSDVEYQLINGHVGIVSPKMFVMMTGDCTYIEWKVILGLQHNFMQDIGVEVNNNTTAIPIHFHGAGLMPMILPKNLNKIAQKSLDAVASYLTIRTVFESIQAKKSVSQSGLKIKDELVNVDSTLSNLSQINAEEKGSGESSITNKRRSKQKLSDEFVTLNYSEETGPRGLEIERSIETLKLIAELKESEELRTKFNNYYCNCVSLRAMEFDPVINLKFTICRPIPWELPVFIMEMGQIEFNETKTYQIDLTFIGPGKVFLSARTRTVMPGLMAWFEDFRIVGSPNSFVFFIQSPEEKTLKKYKNMNERDPDYDYADSLEAVKLTHAHSFDVDETGTHRREKISEDINKIKERYTKLSQPFKEQKNNLILAEICQTTEENWDNSTFKLIFLFTPMSEFYDNNQLIEDYMLVDIHLGPTVPILLRGQVVTSKSNDVSF